jgi:ubiquitin carboxyl-terminal hydrolase 36/42
MRKVCCTVLSEFVFALNDFIPRCKKHVIAEKQFTLHDCPLVLTVHLKRFSPLGRKIGHHIRYDERLSLQPFMSEGQFGPTYSLYGVICHAGGGPNSGHYYAYVKGRDGWYEMNDEMVTYHRGAPASLKSAYMLFYLRDRGQALEAAIRSTSVPDPLTPPKVRLAMKKRRVVDSDEETQEDKGVKETVPFIGPILPSPSPSLNVTPEAVKVRPNVDPQAEIVKKKIEALSKSPAALDDLARYESSEADDKDPEPEEEPPSSSQPTMTSSQRSPSLSQSLPQVSSPDHPGQAVPAASFYAMPNGDSPRSWSKKRKSPKWAGDHTSPKRRFNYPAASHSPLKGNKNSNPFSRLKGGDNLHHRPPPKFTYGKKRRMAL